MKECPAKWGRGCPTGERLPLIIAGSEFCVFVSPGDNPEPPMYSYLGVGYLAAGNDCGGGNWSLVQAEAACTATPACLGFTFASTDPAPTSPVYVYLKSSVREGRYSLWANLGVAFWYWYNPESLLSLLCPSLSQVSYSASRGWQAYSSNRDPRGVRLPASGELSLDHTAITLKATTLREGQVAVSAGYGWATWPVASLFGSSGAPAIPWLALAPNTSRLQA